MTAPVFLPPPSVLETNSMLGVQAPLIIASVPAAGDRSLIGKALISAGQLTVLGVYRCIIPIAGLVSELQVHLTATFASGTVSSALDSAYWAQNPDDASSFVAKTSGTGDGSLTTTVLQTSTLTPAGEKYAILDITLATAAACTFTRAEYNGM
jgi:hypothetical protein